MGISPISWSHGNSGVFDDEVVGRVKRLVVLASSLLLAACSAFGVRYGTETPPYDVIAQVQDVEIRQYPPRLAAEAVLDGPEEDARSAGFRRIAAYIFGGNRAKEQIAMTAPVAQANAGAAQIAMTAPVTAQPAGAGKWVVRFFMPAEYTLETLPEPLDDKVRIVTLPAETMAVYRFSGSRSADAMGQARAVLLARLQGSAWRVAGEPVDWFYDPPWTLPALRRNETAVPVIPQSP